MNLKGIDNVNTWHIVHAFSQNDRRERGNRARVIRNKTISNYKKIIGQSILIEFQNGGTEKHGFYAKAKHNQNVKGVMRFIVPVIYKNSPYTSVITAEVFGSKISFNKTPATLYEIFDCKIKTARPDYANLKSSGLGEKSPVNYTLLEILGSVKDLSDIPYVVDGHLNYYLLNEGKGNYFQKTGKYTGKKDLIAYHNINQDNLDKAIQMGGLAVPSIAITKKETPVYITPVYTRDAWTGVFPGILKASDEIEEEGEMGGFPGMEDMMGGGGEEKRPPQMPPGKPPEMPKQTQDADISNSKGDGKEIWRTTETGRKYLINTETGKVVGGSPVMPIGEVVGKSKAEEPPVDYEKMKFKDLSKVPMTSKINPTGVNKFPRQVFKNKAKAKNHFEKHKKEFKNVGIYTFNDYVAITKRTIESPVGGNIIGHANNQKQIIRYNKKLNLFVKGNPDRGAFTSFVPEGEPGEYYLRVLEEDLKNGGSR